MATATAAPSGPLPRPRIALWKASIALIALLLLTPLGLAYGAVGRVLTASSKRLSIAGTALLALLAAAVLLEVALVEQRHAHEFEAAAARQSDADRLLHELEKEHAFAQTLALLATSLLALLVSQWRFHALVVAWLDAAVSPLAGNDGLRLFVDTLAPLFLVGLLWESLYVLEHWRFVTGLTLGTSVGSEWALVGPEAYA